MRRALSFTLVLLALSSCFNSNTRSEFAEVRCWESGQCWGKWENTDAWSRVTPVKDLDGDVDGSHIWGCHQAPDVDGCDIIDSAGHVSCWRAHDEWAVSVSPECAVLGQHDWHPVGVSMAAQVTQSPS